MKKPTIYEIKRLTAKTNPYYFDKQTMKFFKQTLSMFKVYRTSTEGIFRISAPAYYRSESGAIKFSHYSERLFNSFTNEFKHKTEGE